ncbi:PLP-dependent aminotransferase family protein [Terrarubrum flagellatum]|uniref:MocR-like pyridoxine biosynthesis transcription factor PdxR n=1 Tax=Terrirubrum flagellatum TaxID=2895980 RepID=UPI0031452C86
MYQLEPRRVGRKIVEAIKAQIQDGARQPGDRLPSTRALAVEWGVSRTTITAAYEQLIAEGYLEARQGARATVAAGVRSTANSIEREIASPVNLSMFGRRVLQLARSGAPLAPVTFDFRYGELAGVDFPTLAWRRSLGRAVTRRPPRLRYDDPQGSPALRVALQGYVWRARGIHCDADQIIIVNGSQQGIDLCARLLLDAGDRCVIENPAYNLARASFAASGAALVPIPVDREGIRSDDLPDARLAYVTPSHQFPLGHMMSAARRSALLAWAQRVGAYIVEDDYDGEYRYDVAPVPPLQTMGPDRVIYIGTISKTLSPTLRLGYLIAPKGLRAPFTEAKRLADRHAPTFEQEALADFLASGAYERHVRAARRRNRDRRTALVDSLRRLLGDRAIVTGSEAGLHLIAWLPDVPAEAEAEFLQTTRTAGLGLYPASPLYDAASDKPTHLGVLLGYAALSIEEIEKGVQIFARLLTDWTKSRPGFRASR